VAVVAVLGVLAGCSGGDGDTTAPAPGSTSTVRAPTTVSTPPGTTTLRDWLAAGQGWLTDLSGAAEGVRNLAPDSPSNPAILTGLADGAGRAVAGFRTLPPPATGQAESAAFIRTLEGLEAAARSAAPCESGCGPAYATVLAAQEAFTEALRRLVATAQASG
jgi:hypothetical protein